MASGDTLLILRAQGFTPPTTLGAGYEPVAGASTVVEQFGRLTFDSTNIEYADFHNLMMPQHYAGGGVTLHVRWGAGATTATSVVLSAAFRAVEDDTEDLDTTAHTYVYTNSASLSAPSVIGEVAYDTIGTITDGANMDSVAAGDMFTLRVRRVTTDAGDTLAADVFIYSIEIRET